MSDRDLDDQDWMADEARFEAEEEAAWQDAERRSEAEIEQSALQNSQEPPPAP